jgi:phosphopantetheine--protein transferase-like protein
MARFSSPERPQWLSRAAAVLDASELERVAAMADPDTRAQHAVGRALIRLAGARAAGCRAADVNVAVTDRGRPWLPGLPKLHVNVAHTRRAVVVATASAVPVGVDIEHPAGLGPQPRRLAQRLFAAAAVRALQNLSEDLLADWFSSLWTIKEAVGKALGVGIIPALSEVVVATDGAAPRLSVVAQGPSAEAWTLHQLIAPGGREKIAVALPAPRVVLAPVSVLTLDRFAQAIEAHGATARTCSGSARRRARM